MSIDDDYDATRCGGPINSLGVLYMLCRLARDNLAEADSQVHLFALMMGTASLQEEIRVVLLQ